MALQSEVGFDCDKIDITHFVVVVLQNTKRSPAPEESNTNPVSQYEAGECINIARPSYLL